MRGKGWGKYWVALVVLAGTLAQARADAPDDCSPVNLADPDRKPPSPIARMPILDQDGAEICYAYAASQLIDAYRFSHGDKDTSFITSPFALAVSTMRHARELAKKEKTELPKPDPFGESGEDVAVEAAARYGICSHRVLRDRFAGRDIEGYEQSLVKFFTAYQKEVEDHRRWRNAEQARADLLRVRKRTAREIDCYVRAAQAMPLDALPSMRAILAALDAENPLEYVERLIAPTCSAPGASKKVRLPAPLFRDVADVVADSGKPREQALHDYVGGLLTEKNAQPLSVGFCARLFRHPDYRGVTVSRNPEGELESDFAKDCATHAVLIVGRRWDAETGKCHVIVRNSWGADSCRSIGKWKCVGNDFLMDEERLYKNVFDVTTLGGKRK